jgi:hypothetical protein
MLPQWVLFGTSDSEYPKSTQREPKEKNPGRIREETVIRHKFLEVPPQLHEDSITFLDDLAVVGSRFVPMKFSVL